VVTGRGLDISIDGEAPPGPPVDAALLETVRGVDQVALATGSILDERNTKILDKDGEATSTEGAPTFGFGIDTDPALAQFNPLNVLEGRWPAAPHEVVIDVGTADDDGYEVGDTIEIATLKPKQKFELVGVAQYGSLDSLGNASFAVFTIPAAQELLDRHPILQRSIRLRNPYVDPMNAIQVELLRRYRSGEEAATRPLLRSIGGIAAAATGLLPGQASPAADKAPAATTGADVAAQGLGKAAVANMGGTAQAGSSGGQGRESAVGPDASGAARAGLCRAWQAGQGADHGRRMDAVAFQALVEAAGGADQVAAYCEDVAAGSSAGAHGQGQASPPSVSAPPTMVSPPSSGPPADPGPPASTGPGGPGQGGPPTTTG
jgi:hypothetical protein